MHGTNGTALAVVLEPTIVAPLATFAGIETALAQLRQGIKDAVCDMPRSKAEGYLIDMIRCLDTADTWLGLATRAVAREADRS